MTARAAPPVADAMVRVAAATCDGDLARLVADCPQQIRGARAGQFVLARNPSPGAPPLGRPLSVLFDGDRLELLFNVVGEGTHALADLRPGDDLHLVGPLGAPFDPLAAPLAIVADRGHAGTMLGLARERADATAVLVVADPARLSPAETALRAAFEAAGATRLASFGTLGDMLHEIRPAAVAVGAADKVVAAVQDFAAANGVPGCAALQAPMACGLGVCLVCVRRTAAGDLVPVCLGPTFDLAVFADG